MYSSPSGATGEQALHGTTSWLIPIPNFTYTLFLLSKVGNPSFPNSSKEALHQYVTRIITHKKQTVIRINSMPDHLHILVGITPDVAISDLVRDIKANSSKWINEKRWVVGRFEWQTGFAAFSYAHSQLDVVVRYIKNQEAHHSHQTFREEYLAFLKRFDVPYNPKYVFDAEEASET